MGFALKIWWAIVGLAEARWEFWVEDARKSPIVQRSPSSLHSYFFANGPTFVLYTFRGVDEAVKNYMIKDVLINGKLFKNLAEQQDKNSEESVLMQACLEESKLLSKLPAGFLLASVLFDMRLSQPPTVELSVVGETDYAVFEVKNGSVEVAQIPLKKAWTFDSIHLAATLGPSRPVVEMRFQLRGESYIVLGCEIFWKVMIPSFIAPFLQAKKALAEKTREYMHLACVLYLKKHARGLITAASMSALCRFKNVPYLNSRMISVLIHLKDTEEDVRMHSESRVPGSNTPQRFSNSDEDSTYNSSDSGIKRRTKSEKGKKRKRIRSFSSPITIFSDQNFQ